MGVVVVVVVVVVLGDVSNLLVDRAAAGHPIKEPIPTGTAIRIFTGAVVPPELDTIVMQEDIEVIGEDSDAPIVCVPPGLKLSANRRRAGEDVKKGEEIFTAGHRLRPQDLAAVASAGNGEVDAPKMHWLE